MESTSIEYKVVKPSPSLSHVVESFWMLANHAEEEKQVVILPDGRIDLFFSYSSKEPFHIALLGLGSEPSHSKISPKSVIFAVSFKLLACEYVLETNVASLLNNVQQLPDDFWGIAAADLNDFDVFCIKASDKITELLKKNIDERKRKLFEEVFSSHGSISVKEIAEKVHWSSRQINRYFTEWFGLSLKAYCNILRYRASFKEIKEGNLFPGENFTDQAHFIKDVKKYSGVTPKELTKNKDDRFIQFSVLPKK